MNVVDEILRTPTIKIRKGVLISSNISLGRIVPQLSPQKIYSNFFIDKDISGTLFQTSHSKICILSYNDSILYIVYESSYEILLHHYLHTLQDTLKKHLSHTTSKKVTYNSGVIKRYEKQIQEFEGEVSYFMESYNTDTSLNYNTSQFLKYLLSRYATLQTLLSGNAESLKDSTTSNNYLFHDLVDPLAASYNRMGNKIEENYEGYILNSLDFIHKDEVSCSLVSSGMGAVSLAIQYCQAKPVQKILIVGQIYFETLFLIQGAFSKEQIIYFDPLNEDFKYLDEKILDHKPDIIFVDTISLSLQPFIFTQEHFSSISSVLQKHNLSTKLIIDITTKYFCLEEYSGNKSMLANTLFVSSIGKYWFGGIDTGFGGFIIHSKKDARIKQTRCNSGSNISMSDMFRIPLLPKNEHVHLTQVLNKKMEVLGKKLSGIQDRYPHTCIHGIPLNFYTHKKSFYSNLINIGFIDSKNSKLLERHKLKLVENIIDQAKKRNIDISYSTSYGYLNTRFSLFSRKNISIIPLDTPLYIRVSLGYTNSIKEDTLLLHIICASLEQILESEKRN